MRNHAKKSGTAARKAFRKPIGRQITLMSICCILVTVAVTALLLLAGSSVQTNSILEDDTKTAMASLRQNVTDMNTGAAKCASDLAKDDVLVSSLQGNGRSTIAMTIGMAAKDLGSDVDFITVTDAQGKVLACTVSEQSGESVADMQDVKTALGGTASKGLLEKGTDVKLAVRAAAPVVNNSKIIGIISAGYDLSRNRVLKTLKQNTGCEFSFFLGDTRLNSTITSSGKAADSLKADAAVTGQVISRKAEFAGQTSLFGIPYYAHYDPMTDASGSVIGMYFAGKPIASIEASRRQFILLVVLVTLLLSAVSIFTFYRFSKKRIAEPLRDMSEMAARLASGNLSVSVPQTSADDEIGLLANSLRTMAEQLRLYVGDISRQLNLMSQGDMTSKFEIDYIGDFAPIRNALQEISGSLNTTLAQINSSAQLVSESAHQVAGGSQSLAQGATEQASTVEELSTMVGDVARKVSENSDGVHSMAEALSQAGADVEKSNQKTKNMLEAMAGIQESSDKIEQIIKSIDSIAFQTNILALNAAVEAARAGEAGKGFAVVADEVRNLAGKSAEASKQTAVLISDTRDKVRVGCGLAEETAKGAQDINAKLRLVMQSMDAITSASAAQSTAVARINQGISSVSGVVQTNSATSQECAAASAELSRQAGLLRGEVEKFRLKEANS